MDLNEMKSCKEEELNEHPLKIREDLTMIREWLKKQPHLRVRDDDASLLIFLRSSKYSLERTKEKLDNYYTMFTIFPEIFANRDPFAPDIQALLTVGTMVPLPKTMGDHGPRIVIFNYGYDPDIIPYMTLVKASLMLLDILMVEDLDTVKYGVYIWADISKMTLKYALQFTPTQLTKHLYCMEKGYPLRFKGVQCDNSPPAMEMTMRLIKTCLSAKLRKRMNVYKVDDNTRDKLITTELLPIEYGGTNGSIKELGVIWKKKIESYRDWFMDGAQYRSNEMLRIGTPRTSADVFGVQGTFRKLSID